MDVIKSNVSLEATPTSDTHIVNKSYVDSKQKTISWAEYQALSEEEKKNGTLYNIPDMPTGGTDDFLMESDIATVLDSESTNKQVVGAKDFYNHTSTRNIKTYTEFYQIGLERLTCSILDVINKLPSYSVFEAVIDPTGVTVIAQECPYAYGTLMINKVYPDRVKLYYFPNSDLAEGELYLCEYHPSTGLSEWGRVCTTKVPDVPVTQITGFKDANITPIGDKCNYYVENGWCHLVLEITISIEKLYTWTEAILDSNYNIPIPKSNGGTTKMILASGDGDSVIIAVQSGTLYMFGNAKVAQYFGSISYPVAEDWQP